jgi:hypothetical protein
MIMKFNAWIAANPTRQYIFIVGVFALIFGAALSYWTR